MGSKRNELSKDHIDEIVKIYGDNKEGEYSKRFDNEDFGYRKITVERPLRLNFQISEERIKELYQQTAFSNLATSRKKGQAGLDEIEEGKKLQQKIIEVLHSISDHAVYKNRELLTKKIKNSFKDHDVTIPAPLLKAILAALSEKDETSDICLDSKGNLEPDADLRDTENVPLKEDIHEYFEREVKPHVPDAWIDESKTKVGYEIPFTRHFYKYTPLRSSEEILVEIKELEAEILDKLKKVLG
jgi:type I restriction enzyme M protein